MEPQQDTPPENVEQSNPPVGVDESQAPSEQPGVVTAGLVPNNKKKIILIVAGVIALFALAGAVAMILSKSSNDSGKVTATVEAKQTVEISITDTGFSPSTLAIKSGATVTWRNDTQSPKQIGSNPYPDHTSLPDFYSVEPIAPGGIYTYTFSKTGEWGYADYTNPTVSGTVVVQ